MTAASAAATGSGSDVYPALGKELPYVEKPALKVDAATVRVSKDTMQPETGDLEPDNQGDLPGATTLPGREWARVAALALAADLRSDLDDLLARSRPQDLNVADDGLELWLSFFR